MAANQQAVVQSEDGDDHVASRLKCDTVGSEFRQVNVGDEITREGG
jgi:hypothetical protein